MSQLLILNYIHEIESLIQHGGSANEDSIRKAFSNLLDAYCKPRDLRLIDELEYATRSGSKVYPDGTLKDALRLTHGYWEAKDEADDLDGEIAKKRAKGYPTDNILFENSKTAILIQNDREAMRVNMRDVAALDRLVTSFVSFERPEVSDFRRAVEKFKDDLPKVLEALREMIDAQQQSNKPFDKALKTFLKLCRDNIHADITLDDAREMLIQHILTEDIFLRIFDDSQFHRENNVARELQKVAETFFTGTTKKNTLRGLESYYGAIRQAAASIADHHEKQGFLKAIYENFYKVYNPKLADRLGVVYTPSEVVRFMLGSAEALLHRHFGKLLQDHHVEILDPATGTGTFITDLIEHLKGNKAALEYKYKNEIHCNEIAILPYYIANLNIEFTYAQLTGQYEEFPHICFVDTLDNLGFEKTYTNQQRGFDFGLTAENTERVIKQNQRKISVIIGNPPYNANQMNENDNNKNRVYEGIDKRIKETYIAESNAQKTKVYDMYARFFRWAADRINADGVIAFITNRSFIDSRTFDGFRKTMSKEFNEIYIVDLGGDVRANPKLSGTTHNVFGIQTGVAVSFWVKKHKQKGCKIFYARRPEMEIAADKLAWLAETNFANVPFEHVTPDDKGNWINLADNDFDSLLPLASKDTKAAKTAAKERAIFKLYSLGVSTNRDDWVYDYSPSVLEQRMRFFVDQYLIEQKTNKFSDKLKWSRNLKRRSQQGRNEPFSAEQIRISNYRPFVRAAFYDSQLFIDERGSVDSIFPSMQHQQCLGTIGDATDKPFSLLAAEGITDLNYLSPAAAGTKLFPLYRYDEVGNRVDNITDWALKQFRQHYERPSPQPSPASGRGRSAAEGEGKAQKITKEAIFHYCYAVLHDPLYREKYALNLKREFPRIPFYEDFWQWVAWGEALMQLHIGYESVEPFQLKRADIPDEKSRAAGLQPKALLRADKDAGSITLDSETTLRDIPSEAWDYKLGNRCALEWVLDQYKEKKPKDPTIREKFDTYRFADYKEKVIDLLMRVTTVSVETQRITQAMKAAAR